jgi:hypothetical protein
VEQLRNKVDDLERLLSSVESKVDTLVTTASSSRKSK